MSELEMRDLGLTDKNGGCRCGPGAHAAHDSTTAPVATSPGAEYLVEGMTCAHCVRSVTEELSALDGVTGVNVELNTGGASRVIVSSDAPLEQSAVQEAVEEAGYRLAARP